MSTRATYSFESSHVGKTVVYIHYDGYPEGAAGYLYQTLIKPSKGNLATQFIRANEMAEITQSHDAHGDTDFQYHVSGIGPEAEIKAYQLIGDQKDPIYVGKLHEFIHRYSKYLVNYHPFKMVQSSFNRSLLNLVTAEKALEHPLSHLRLWKGRFENSANWVNGVNDAKSIIAVFPELKTVEMASFNIC